MFDSRASPECYSTDKFKKKHASQPRIYHSPSHLVHPCPLVCHPVPHATAILGKAMMNQLTQVRKKKKKSEKTWIMLPLTHLIQSLFSFTAKPDDTFVCIALLATCTASVWTQQVSHITKLHKGQELISEPGLTQSSHDIMNCTLWGGCAQIVLVRGDQRTRKIQVEEENSGTPDTSGSALRNTSKH